ncbi:MAG TPA: divalent metal cation transporter [Verrucomicrobiae bacterium]|nr:divalent metal cation transporter [Verrucomicrobiae bacterium]
MRQWKRWLAILGPGLITGASDDDPSGISTYSIAGASAGFSMLWVALLSTPMMAVVQGMCARIALVSGSGLARVMVKRLPLWLMLPLAIAVVAANTLNAGADLEGMAASANMVFGFPDALWVLFFGTLLTVLQIAFHFKTIASVLKWMTVVLFAYVVTAFVVKPDWIEVLRRSVLPEIHPNVAWLTTLMAVLGTTITPYLFFWQADLEIEEEKASGNHSVLLRKSAGPKTIADMHLDVNAGMIFSNLVAFFIIVATAATLYAHGERNIATAQDAARALEPLAGRFAYLLFTLGMVGTGLLAIPALVGSSAYVAAETLNWHRGLNLPLRRAHGFYGALVLGTIVAMIFALVHADPIAALFWCAVINGIVAVPLLAVIVAFAGSEKLMGKWRSSPLALAWGWFTVAAMALVALSIFVFWGKS